MVELNEPDLTDMIDIKTMFNEPIIDSSNNDIRELLDIVIDLNENDEVMNIEDRLTIKIDVKNNVDKIDFNINENYSNIINNDELKYNLTYWCLHKDCVHNSIECFNTIPDLCQHIVTQHNMTLEQYQLEYDSSISIN